MKKRIKEDISEYYATIADEVTHQFSNKEILLLFLRYVTYQNGLRIIHKTFFDSLHINGHPSGQTIGNSMKLILRNVELKHMIVQVLSGSGSRAASVIKKKEKPLAEYIHCKSHILNLAISFAWKISQLKRLWIT